jgi:hypothetical protein
VQSLFAAPDTRHQRNARALAVLRDLLPDLQPPITADMIVNIVGLTERIEDQVKISERH